MSATTHQWNLPNFKGPPSGPQKARQAFGESSPPVPSSISQELPVMCKMIQEQWDLSPLQKIYQLNAFADRSFRGTWNQYFRCKRDVDILEEMTDKWCLC